MTPSPQMQPDKKDDKLVLPLNKLVAILTLASLLGGAATAVSATYNRALEASEGVKRLEESTVKRDEMKELKDDVKEIRQDLRRYLDDQRKKGK